MVASNLPLCPYCGKMIDGWTHSQLGDFVPEPGDWSVCAYCGEKLVFMEDQIPRIPTDEELKELEKFPGILGELNRVQQLMKSEINPFKHKV